MPHESLSSSTSRLVAMASFMAFSFICMYTYVCAFNSNNNKTYTLQLHTTILSIL